MRKTDSIGLARSGTLVFVKLRRYGRYSGLVRRSDLKTRSSSRRLLRGLPEGSDAPAAQPSLWNFLDSLGGYAGLNAELADLFLQKELASALPVLSEEHMVGIMSRHALS